ncbi:micro-fibrillar-associated protein 1 [Pestalotiopsis sp. NC0098]|nr:micro-fibrillar-associated protein 1 [Pestalotiopsis sp. NC0098]
MVIKPRIQRHYAGKARGGDSSSEDSSDDEQPQQQQQQKKKTPAPPPKVPSAGRIISSGHAPIKPVPQEKRVTAEELERKAAEEGFVTEEESGGDDAGRGGKDGDDDESSSGEEEDDSEEEESSDEDDRPRRNLMIRPKFIPKSQRNAAQGGGPPAGGAEDPDKAEKEEAARRQAEADAMIEEQIRKDQAARAAGRMFWEDGDEAGNQGSDVDTEDDADPEAEAAAWKVRELRRIKRDREAVEAREREIAEVERRRNLTEEERRAEDEAHLARQRDERDGRGKMAFMGKYFHKGAFFQDSEEAGALAARDVMGARFEDEVDRSLLPAALQMRDATKLGRKGASKYRDLKSEDTGRWGEFRDHRPGREMRDGGDWRGNRDRDGPGGANAIPLGDRRKDRDDARDRSDYRPRDDGDRPRRRRSNSRSRSPRRDRDRDDYGHRRKRDSSREADRYEGDKRRRVDSR